MAALAAFLDVGLMALTRRGPCGGDRLLTLPCGRWVPIAMGRLGSTACPLSLSEPGRYPTSATWPVLEPTESRRSECIGRCAVTSSETPGAEGNPTRSSRCNSRLTFAQGNEIHLGPGQERQLPHEAWHVVPQRQGWVQVTTQLRAADGGVALNDDPILEHKPDRQGALAADGPVAAARADDAAGDGRPADIPAPATPVAQRPIGVDAEQSVPVTLAPVAPVNVDDRIRALLVSLVFYNTPLAATVNSFHKTADHGPLCTVIENAHQQMSAATVR